MAPIQPIVGKKPPALPLNAAGGHKKAPAPITIKKKVPPPPPKVAKPASPIKVAKAPVNAKPKSVE